jgi:hypothetical protein|tara:strand:- start:24333 stop:24590 length:258 start_codon:yes stop_codon:yes gene_type:complete
VILSITKYNQLNLNQKGEILFSKGNYIDYRIEYNKYKIALYSLGNFYVEVFYDVHNNEIKRINALENEQDWHGYLDSINLEYLMR